MDILPTVSDPGLTQPKTVAQPAQQAKAGLTPNPNEYVEVEAKYYEYDKSSMFERRTVLRHRKEIGWQDDSPGVLLDTSRGSKSVPCMLLIEANLVFISRIEAQRRLEYTFSRIESALVYVVRL